MSNLGIVQTSAATTMGLNSSTTVLYEIAMLENSNEQKLLTFEGQAKGVEDQNASTIALGDAQAKQTRMTAWGTIAGATTALLIESGTGVSALSAQSGVDTLNNELTNVNSFKEGVLNAQPNDLLIQGDEFEMQSFADQLDQLGSMSTEKPNFNKDDFLSGDLSLAEKGALFNDNNIDYNAEAAAFADNNKQAALDTADRVQDNLKSQIDEKNKTIQMRLSMGQSFSQTLDGLISGSLQMASAEAQVQAAEDQVLQQNAEFFTKNAQSEQQTLEQQAQQAAEAISQTIQNLQTVAQSSSRV